MKKIQAGFIAICFLGAVMVGCDVLKGIPTNTTGGVFSLNGNWKMESSNDNNALAGSIVTVYPIAGAGNITTLQNNTYCVRMNDVVWKSITSSNGNFSVSNLVNSCNSALVYKAASLTVINTDEIRLSGTTAAGAALVQTWKRSK